MRDDHAPGHLGDAELSGFLDDDLAPDERRRIAAHLDSCDDCRRELVEVGRLAASLPATPRRRPSALVWLAAGGALAAGLAALLLPTAAPAPPVGHDTTRAPAQTVPLEGRARIEATLPLADTVRAAPALVFAWRPVRADVFRFTLLSETGEPVWSVETADTVLTLPNTVHLGAGAFFWRVDAVAEGIVATTGIRRLRVVR